MEDVKEAPISVGFTESNIFLRLLRDTYNSFRSRRDALGLSDPGPMDKIKKELDTDVLCSKFMFTGLKADINRPLSISPLFQYTHAFALGPQMPPYGFAALLGTSSVLMQGNIDNDGSLSAVFHKQWTKSFVTKTQASISPEQQTMVQLDGDYTGKDFTASIKSINPSALDGGLNGIYVGSYLQSVTPGLALGVEAVWQRMAMSQGPETVLSYCAKYKGQDWIGTAQLNGLGAFSTSYWRKLTEKIEAGADLNVQFAPGLGGGGMMGSAPRKEGVATIGARYEFRLSNFRAQLDSAGKLSCLLEKRVLPTVQLTFAGEIDHVKSTAKVGLGLSVEIAPEDVISQQAGEPASSPSVPY